METKGTDPLLLMEGFIEQVELSQAAGRPKLFGDFFTLDRISELISAETKDPIRYNLLFSRLAAVRGMKGRSEETKKLIKQAATMARREADSLLAAVQSNRVIQQHLPESLHGDLPRFLVPPGFDMDAGGIYATTTKEDGSESREKITTAPILLTKRGRDTSSGHQQVEVSWVEFGGPQGGAPLWRRHTVDRKVLFDSKHLTGLISFGAPVTSVNVSDVIKWFTAFEDINQHKIPMKNGSSSIGWQPDGSFIMPDEHIRLDHHQQLALFPSEGMEPIMKSLHSRGTWEGWLNVVEHLTDHPLAMIAIYASVAAPLAHFVNASNFAVDWSNETSTGKTTALRVGASVWGLPDEKREDGFIYKWDATQVWVERAAAFLGNLPLLLDETKTVKNPKHVADTVYNFCIGKGRGRGTLQGVDTLNTWNSVLMSTGEQKLTSFTRDGGVQGRVIALQGAPISGPVKEARETANFVRSRLMHHYGHLGKRMVKYMVGAWEDRDRFTAAFEDLRSQFGDITSSRIGGRLAEYVALLDLAKTMCESLGVPAPRTDPITFLIAALREGSDNSDMAKEAFVSVVSWAAFNKHRFAKSRATNEHGPPGNGYAGVWSDCDPNWKYIAFEKKQLGSLLEMRGHRFSEVVPRWKARDWLVSTAKGLTKAVSLDGISTHCVCLRREVYEQLIKTEAPIIAADEQIGDQVDLEAVAAKVVASDSEW